MGGGTGVCEEGNDAAMGWGRKPWLGVPAGGMKDWAMLMARVSMLARERKGWSAGGH